MEIAVRSSEGLRSNLLYTVAASGARTREINNELTDEELVFANLT
jgi:hypothetical protein